MNIKLKKRQFLPYPGASKTDTESGERRKLMAEIAKIIKKAVEEKGVIPFKEFMRLALYCPEYGYYEQGAGQIGRDGDYYTNVSIGSLFGQLLAFQFARWLEE